MGAVIDQIHSDVSVEPEATPPVTGITGPAWELREIIREAQQRAARDRARTSAEGFDD
jgi:hypothetical protein